MEDEALIDIEQAAQTLIYQDAVITGPAWAQEAAAAKANFAQRLPGTSEWTIGSGSGSLSQLSFAERQGKKEKEALENLGEMADQIEKAQEFEREREEWSRASHSYAGMEMTGAEWGEFADALQGDTPLRRWLVDEIMKKGKSQSEATRQADQIAILARMQSMPESDWTPEMKALDRELDANPERRKEFDDYLNRGRNFEATSPGNVRDATVSGTKQSSSVEAGAELLASGCSANADFPSAPNLTAEYGRAVATTEPLDGPKPAQIVAASVRPSPSVSPGGGLDV